MQKSFVIILFGVLLIYCLAFTQGCVDRDQAWRIKVIEGEHGDHSYQKIQDIGVGVVIPLSKPTK